MKPSQTELHLDDIKHRYYPGSRKWRKDKGLMVLSDFAREYESVRCTRGSYNVPLPSDFK